MTTLTQKLVAGTASMAAMFALAGCGPRQHATEIGIQTTGWGKEVNVSTGPGLKCYTFCSPGEDWLMLSTGEHALHIVATPPDAAPNAPDQKLDAAAYGVVKTKEGLTLKGNVTIWVQFQNVQKADIENLYRTFPPQGANSAEYQDKILTRLAQHALDSVQQAYRDYSVTEVTTKTNGKGGIEEAITNNVNDTFKAAGFGSMKVKSVVLAGINLGKAAEERNEQIGLAQVQMAVAEKQIAAAAKLREAQNSLAPITSDLIKQFKADGVDASSIASVLCLHEKMNSEDFSTRHPQSCFPSMQPGK